MARLSISYRRSDSADITGRIFDRLVGHYGKKSVFRDIDNVPIGEDFRSHIQDVLHRTDVLLAVVGPEWRGPEASGRSRVDEENDLVRVEVETGTEAGHPRDPGAGGRRRYAHRRAVAGEPEAVLLPQRDPHRQWLRFRSPRRPADPQDRRDPRQEENAAKRGVSHCGHRWRAAAPARHRLPRLLFDARGESLARALARGRL
jgi:hypothetical protein